MDSNDENVELYSYTPVEDDEETYEYGSGVAGGDGCTKLDSTSLQTKMLSKAILYMAQTYNKADVTIVE